MPSKKRHLLSRLAERSTRLLFLGSKRIYNNLLGAVDFFSHVKLSAKNGAN